VQRQTNFALSLTCLIASVAALSVANVVFAPMAFALLIIALLWPLQAGLQARMPGLVALAISILVLVVAVTVFAFLMAWGFGRVARWVIADAGRFQALIGQVDLWLEGHGLAVATLWTDHFNVGWLVRALQTISARLNSALSFWLVVIVYVILGLLEVLDIRGRIASLRNGEMAAILLDTARVTGLKLRRYMFVRTQMSIVTGILVFAFAWLAGLPLALEWGVIAFVLNYIPVLGPLIATLFPTIFAVAEFQSLQAVIAVFVALNIIQFVIGSYVEPRVSGRNLAMSPFLVLFSVFFWTFLWGLFGAFIGVPITIAVLTFCERYPPLQALAQILGGSPVNVEPLSPA
jgi:predicted PurR-regulated permease PerM